MQIKFKKLTPEAQAPAKHHYNDACFDIHGISCERITNEQSSFFEYGTGLSLEIPDGHVGLIFPRSSISKTASLMCNSVGVIDAGYRGEVRLRFTGETAPYEIGQRIGQLMILPLPLVEFIEADDLNDSQRGSGGFGSTGQ